MDHGGNSATAAVTVNSVLSLAPTPANVAIGSTLKLTPTGGTAPYSLALVSGGGVSGTFGGYRGTPRYIVAKLDATSGALDQQFAPYTQSQVVVPSSGVAFNALLPSGNSLYVGGEILGVAGSNQLLLNGVVKLDATTGAPNTTFMAAAGVYANRGISPMVFDLTLSGNSLYAGGDFSRNLAYTGSTFTSYTNKLVKFDAMTGSVDTNFTRYGGPDYRVYSITQAVSCVRISGDFDTCRGTFSGYSLTFDPVSGNVL